MLNKKKQGKAKVIMAVTSDLVTDNRVNKVAQTLTNMGMDVTLVGRELSDSPSLQKKDYACFRFKLWFNKSALFYAGYNLQLFLYLLIHKCNIILANDLDTLLACFVASKIKRTKLVYDSHEYFCEVPELIGRKRTKKIWESIECHIVPKLKQAYTVCHSIAEIYTNRYHVPFKVVRNLPNRQKPENKPIEPIIQIQKPFVIYQGAINKGRGVEEIIEAINLLDDINLAIAGSGDNLNSCKELVTRLGLENRIFFLGRMPIDQLQFITKEAIAGLSVEKDLGLNYRYALPNKLFDYINAGIPVIISALPEMEKIINQYNVGITIKKTTPENISKAIKSISCDPQQAKVFRANCQKASQELCWEHEEKIIEDIFEECLRN